jgi:hypothetical protein
VARRIAPDRQQRVPDWIGAALEFVYQVGAVIARGLQSHKSHSISV